MSSNSAAALAAKRRSLPSTVQRPQPQRNLNKNSRVFENQPENQQNRVVSQEGAPEMKKYTIPEILKLHDIKLYNLERYLSSKKFENNTSENTELTSTKVDNKVLNQVENNTVEITELKKSVNVLNRNLQNSNTLITTMKATILSQTNELNQLKQQVSELENWVTNKDSLNVEEEHVEEEHVEEETPEEEKEEVKEAVKEEVKEEVNEEVKEAVKEEVKEEVNSLINNEVSNNIELVIN